MYITCECAARIDDDHGTLYPFSVECAVHDRPGLRRTAPVSFEHSRVLVVEPHDSAADIDTASLHASLAWAKIDSVQMCRRIPVDKRHNAKIDYSALHKLMGEKVSDAG